MRQHLTFYRCPPTLSTHVLRRRHAAAAVAAVAATTSAAAAALALVVVAINDVNRHPKCRCALARRHCSNEVIGEERRSGECNSMTLGNSAVMTATSPAHVPGIPK